MSNLTQEAILAELAKLSDGKGRAMSFYDGQTIVPNSLLEQVWLEAERKTEERILEMLEDYDFSTIWRQVAWNPDAWESFGSDDLIVLIKGENK